MRLSFSVLCVCFGSVLAELMFAELKQHTPAQYSKLMDNQHIVMMGDCLMRYQYLSLVYLLTTNTFLSPDVHPNILNELEFNGDWISFYDTSSKLFAPNEHCDCFRKPHMKEGAKDVYENRYYFNTERNISISYLQYFGDRQQFSGHWQPSDGVSRHVYKPPDTEYVEPKWVYHSIEKVLVNIASKLTPTPSVLVLNTGHWVHNWADAAHTKRVMGLAASLFDRVIYKTTNYNKDRRYSGEHDSAACQHPGVECMDLSWTQHLPAHQYWDMLHFMPGVYTDINMQFINQVASGKTMSFTTLGADSFKSIVEIESKLYVVDNQGLLRPFNLPQVMDEACKLKISSSHHIPARAALKLLLGERVDDVCKFISALL